MTTETRCAGAHLDVYSDPSGPPHVDTHFCVLHADHGGVHLYEGRDIPADEPIARRWSA